MNNNIGNCKAFIIIILFTSKQFIETTLKPAKAVHFIIVLFISYLLPIHYGFL